MKQHLNFLKVGMYLLIAVFLQVIPVHAATYTSTFSQSDIGKYGLAYRVYNSAQSCDDISFASYTTQAECNTALGAVNVQAGSGNTLVGGTPCQKITDPNVSISGTTPVCFASVSKYALTASSDAGTTGSGTTDTSTAFVPLTNIPFINEAGNAGKFQDFLNQVYKICIGLAAALAVLQIVRAGIMYMGGDSVTEKSAARNLIVQSLLGLLLVLSPVIVFTIINPSILSLKINNLKELAIPASSGGATSPAAPGSSATPTAVPSQCSLLEIDGYGPLIGQVCATKFGPSSHETLGACCDNSSTPEPNAVCCAHPKNP